MIVRILSTGTANLASVIAALARRGVAAEITSDPAEVEDAERLIIPGVGTFGAAMESLRARGLVAPLRRRLEARRPTLGVCLGLQLLAEASDESPGVEGLGILPLRVTRFAASQPAGQVTLRVPQLGWNTVIPDRGCTTLRAGYAYFANSYRVGSEELETLRARGWRCATSAYGGGFVSAIESACARIVACQFHPELSGPWGIDLVGRWLVGSSAAAPIMPMHAPPTTLLTRVIPCLDVSAGRVVKGVKFATLRDAGDPAALAEAYEAQGADELVMLDVSATPQGRASATETVRAVRRVLSIPLTVGGGVRSVDDAGRLLDAGADKVAVNSAAVERPALITEIATRFGAQCAVLALDAARNLHTPGWHVVTHSGTRHAPIDAPSWARQAADHGAGEILLTSFDRDGTRSGYDLELLRAVSAAASVPIIASGGADTAEHMIDALKAGASAVLAASIFHDGVHTVHAIKDQLSDRGAAVRRRPAEEYRS